MLCRSPNLPGALPGRPRGWPAWSKWYYADSFAGLRLLSSSAAIRTAIARDATEGLAALTQLNDRELDGVVGNLTEQDAQRVLATFTAAGGTIGGNLSEPDVCFDAARRGLAWASTRATQAHANQTLRLFLVAINDHPTLPVAALAEQAAAVVCLDRLLREHPPAWGLDLVEALAALRLATVYQLVGTAEAELLQPLLQVSHPCLLSTMHSICSHGHARPALVTGPQPTAAAGGLHFAGPRRTTWGGIFLLLPLLDALPLDGACADWPAPPDADAARVLRLLILATCLGGQRAALVAADDVVRDVLDIPPQLSLAEIGAWLAGIPEANVAGLLAHIREWYRSTWQATGQTILLSRVRLRGAPAAVLVDAARGMWLDTLRYRAGTPRPALERLPASLAADPPQLLLCDAALFEDACALLPNMRVESLDRADADAQDEPIDALRARLPGLAQDLQFLARPRVLRASPAADRCVRVLAQGVLRAFAWRLPGFARSTLPYVLRNFLDFPASLEDEPHRHVVRVGRPPLYFILHLAGLSRQTYALSGSDGRPFALFAED